MTLSLSGVREIRCRCGAWRLEDDRCAWCDAEPPSMPPVGASGQPTPSEGAGSRSDATVRGQSGVP